MYSNFIDKYDELFNSKKLTIEQKKELDDIYNKINNFYNKIKIWDNYNKNKFIKVKK